MYEIPVGCKQIVDYMKEAGFYELFGKRVLQSKDGKNWSKTLKGRKFLLNRLLGALGTNTLSCSFLWDTTPEGYAFWSERNDWLIAAFSEVPLKYKKVIKHD